MKDYRMSIQHAPKDTSFDVADILVSRTDRRGVIASINSSFEHVSGYAWPKLQGAPHKILRHEDMPKGVFYLFWEMLQKNRAVGAYVKNRRKDGSHYWVFACAAPIQGGYLSVRIKPTAEGIEMAQKLYGQLLDLEAELSPSESAEKLVELLHEAGFRDYGAFMSERISVETRARNAEIGRKPHDMSRLIRKLADQWGEIDRLCKAISANHQSMRHTPINLGVQASKLQSQGVALGGIARNFSALAEKIKEMMSAFQKSSLSLEDAIAETRFLTCQSRLMQEVVAIFDEETTTYEGISWDVEVDLLNSKSNADFERAVQGLSEVRSSVQRFMKVSDSIAFLLSGLSVSSVMCDIEGAYMSPEAKARVTGTSAELENFRSDTQHHLAELKEVLSASVDLVNEAQRLFSSNRHQNAERMIAS